MAYQFPISKFLRRVLNESTLHGVFHLINPKSKLAEKIMWAVIIGLVVFCSFSLLTVFWYRYLTNPTVIALNRNYHEWNTTFPSITVCFHNRLNVTARDNLVKQMKPKNPEKFKNFLGLLAEANIFRLQTLMEFDEYSFLDLKATQNQITNFVDTKVMLDNGQEAGFKRVVTELGICYTFNSDITRFMSTDPSSSSDEYSHNDLIQVTMMERDIMASLENLTENGNIFYHGPFEVPSILKRLIVSASTSAFLTITFKPVIITADSTIENLYVQQRRCRFPYESNLVMFPRYYSHSLCLLDCRLRLFLKYCECVPFFYNLDVETPVCRIKQLRCIVQNLVTIRQSLSSCGCLKDCNTISFTLQSYVLFEWFNDPLIKWNMETPKVRYSRRIIYGFVDAMASTGGICGLFFGASVLTFVELVYSLLKHLLKLFTPKKNKTNTSQNKNFNNKIPVAKNVNNKVKFNKQVTLWY
ncbi:pickpocket protein 19-like [Sabethes cyaneus]|uniref:pickpocket protein 19-like n=1 Tax=Sabethes cyaneus TaxID=53552 RepID=UPI00237EB94D|nr:pickpocket protein 19-like [Sabethes cyaneus]